MSDWKTDRAGSMPAERRPEIEYEVLDSGSCFIGDCLCYHPQDPISFAKYQANEIAAFMQREQMPIIHFLGMGRGLIQFELAKMLPPGVRMVLWDEHPNLSKVIVPADVYDAVRSRWVIVTDMQKFVNVVDQELAAVRAAQGQTMSVRRTLAVQPGLTEVLHWPLGFIDWMKRNRKHLRSMNPLAFIPSPRAILRISQFGDIPGVHQLNKIGNRDAIVVSCGPSLNDDTLKSIRMAAQRGAVVFCVGQALKKLNDAGIVPHYVFVADPSESMYKMVSSGQFGLVLCDGMVSELFTNQMPGRMVFYNILSSHAHQAVCDMLGWPIFDDSFATVSEIAVCIARVLGAKRIFMAGVDYAAGPETADNPFPQYVSSFRMPTYDGRLVWTNAHYNHGRKWLESHVVVAPGTVYRYSEGLPVAGEIRMRTSKDMLGVLAKGNTPMPLPKAPKPRECDVLTKLMILNYCKKKGFDANDAVSEDHPDDFKYALMGSSHERKLTLIELAMNRVLGSDANDKPTSPAGSVVPAEE